MNLSFNILSLKTDISSIMQCVLSLRDKLQSKTLFSSSVYAAHLDISSDPYLEEAVFICSQKSWFIVG